MLPTGRVSTGEEIVAAGAPEQKGASKYKFTPKVLNTLLSCIADGLNIKQACTAAGISRLCYDNWREKFPEFAEALEEAREQSRRVALAGIKAAGDRGDWRALESFLKMSFQADYKDRQPAVQINNNQLVISEEQRQRIIKLREQILRPPKPVEAIEVEVQPLGLPIPHEAKAVDSAETKTPLVDFAAEQAERAMREKLNENLAKSTAYQEPEPGCYVEPWGDGNHPAIKSLGLGPK